PAAPRGAEPAITPEGAPHGTSQGTPRVASQGEHATAPPPLPRGTAAGTPQGTRGAGEGPPATPERIPTPAAPAGAAPAARPGGEPPGPGIQPSPAKPAVTAADHPANPGTQPAQPANQGSGHNNSGPHPGPRPTDPPPGSMPPAVPATGGVRTGSTKDSGDGGTPIAGPPIDPRSGAPKPATTAATEQGPGKPVDTFVTAPKRGPPSPEGSPTSAAGKPGSAPGSEAPGAPAAPENAAGPNGVSVERPVTGKQGQEPTPAPNNEQNVPSHAGDQGTGTPGAAEPAGAQPADATVRNTESGTPGRPGQPKADDQPTSGDRPDSSSATRETTADARAADTPLIERIHQEMRGSRGVLSVRELATRLGVKKHQVRAAVEGDTHFAGAEHAAQFGTARYLVVQDSGQAFVLRPVRGAAEQRSVTASEGAGEGEGQRTGSAKEGGLASDVIVVDRGATSGTATAGKPGDPRPALWERIAGLQSKLSDARAAQVEQRAAANALHTERADLVTELVGRRAAELLKRPSGGEPALPGPTELPSLDFGAGRAGAKAGSGVTVRVLGEAPKQAPDARAAEIGERIAEIDTQLGARAAAEQAAATQEGKLTGHLAEAEVLARRLTQYIDGNPGAGPASLASIGLGRHDLPTSFDEHGWAQHGSRHWAPENNRPRVEQQRPELRAPADTAAPTRLNTADRQTRVWFTKVLIPASLVLARIIAPHPATIPAELAMLHSEPTISTRTSLGGDPAAGGKIVIVEQAKAPPSAGAEPEVTRSSEAPGSGSGGPSDAGLADQPIWLWRDRLISAATLNPDEELGGTPHLDAFGRTESAAQRLPAPGIDAVTWAQYGPAQRAEAWDRHADSVRDAAQAAEQRIQQLRGAAAGHKDLTRSVTQQIEQLRTEQRRLTAQLRQLTRVTTVLRAQQTLPRRKLSQTQRHWRPELGGQRAAERAARQLAELGQRNADLQRGIAELTQSRTQQQRWRGASTQRLREAQRDHGRDWIRAHYQHASAARQWAALHRDVAEQTRAGRRQLAEIELYRAAGTSAAEQVERAVAEKMLRRLAARGVPERALAKLASLAEQGAHGRRVLSAVLAAGLGSDDAAIRTLARLARDNRLGWSPETRRAVLAALPRTMAAWSRVISPPRNAAWQYQQRRARQLATAGRLVVGVGLLGGTLTAVGLPS
ncbi:MAG: hypothetical protein QOI75_6631, partial [Pseudonocardiales bacterium]|nr:hypothetical protein [Pseudonocardiales bacterium]